MSARNYSPRSTFHVDAKILDGLSATRNLAINGVRVPSLLSG